MRLFFWSDIFWFALDQGTKYLVVHWMRLDEIGYIPVWPPFVNFHMGWNTGINFGLFSGSPDATRWVLIAIAIGISVWVTWWAKTGLTRPVALLAAGAIVGGALGNVLDRFIYGAVADFLNMSCCGINNPFTFNLADVGIFLGAFGLLFFSETKKMTP